MKGNHHNHFLGLDKNKLLIAFLLVTGMMMVEFCASFITRSMALTSDATHMLVDAFALGCAFWAARIVHKSHRAEIYAALINGIILILMALFILKSSFNRFLNPIEIHYQLMIIVAIAGFLINLIQFFILRKGNLKNINIRGAYRHVISDALASIGVILGGTIIHFTGWYKIDPILGFVITLAVFRYGFCQIKDSIRALKKKK